MHSLILKRILCVMKKNIRSKYSQEGSRGDCFQKDVIGMTTLAKDNI